jgi:hypothetical protein
MMTKLMLIAMFVATLGTLTFAASTMPAPEAVIIVADNA